MACAARLGAPTDGNADGKRPMGSGRGGGGGDDARPAKAARVDDADWMEDDDSDDDPNLPLRQGSLWVAPPPPASLRGMPPQVIGILVGQAALGARKARLVAREICQWMHNFCEVAASSGVPCDDDWFRLALGAFGPVPEKPVGPMVFPDRDGKTQSGYVDVRGNEVDAPAPSAPPPQSGFGTWRQLFEQLCVALDGPEARRGRTHNEIAAGAPASFWDDVATHFYKVRRVDRSMYVLQFASAGLSQRRLDELLDALLNHALEQWIAGNALDRKRLEEAALINEEVKRQWEAWMRGDAPTDSWWREVGPWKALLTLFVLRGARPFRSDLYHRLDIDLYRALHNATTGKIRWEVALALARDALNAGANPNYNGEGLKPGDIPEDPTLFHMDNFPSMLNIALYSDNVDFVKLLVDAGAVISWVRVNQFWDALNSYLKKLEGKVVRMPEGQEKRDIQETTMKLLEMLERVCAPMRGDGAAHMHAQLQHWRNANRWGGNFELDWVYQTIGRIKDMLVEIMRKEERRRAENVARERAEKAAEAQRRRRTGQPLWHADLGFEPGEGPQNRNDHHIKWKFWLKGRVDDTAALREGIRLRFAGHVSNRIFGQLTSHWDRRLVIRFEPREIDLVNGGGTVPLTLVQCDLYVPANVAPQVFSYLDSSWRRHNNPSQNMERILKIAYAKVNDDTDYPRNMGRLVPIEQMRIVRGEDPPQYLDPFPNMTARQYNTLWKAWRLVAWHTADLGGW